MAAGRGEAAVDQHDHPFRQPFDLAQHVGADDHGAALPAELLEEVDEVEALDRIGAVQGFVEDHHLWLGHAGRRRSSFAAASPC